MVAHDFTKITFDSSWKACNQLVAFFNVHFEIKKLNAHPIEFRRADLAELVLIRGVLKRILRYFSREII